ncbi:hypothetical protein BC834DRAFT_970134 [Gloeopeniophorella convolvens]|nr:hypothetical protein BC834DRAFT_970134 [Gloeopeniophorella convolvens]
MAGDLTISSSVPLTLGLILLSIFLNAYLFGIITQQFISYWFAGFKDRLSVNLRSLLFKVECCGMQLGFAGVSNAQLPPEIMLTSAVSSVVYYGRLMDLTETPWPIFFNGIADGVLVLSSHIFLAIRIFNLTQSRLQGGVILVFALISSALAFATVGKYWKVNCQLPEGDRSIHRTAIAWRTLQVLTDILITGASSHLASLTRALLRSRSGARKFDFVVKYFVRCAIQTGLFASAWAIAELATWFILPQTTAYLIFATTVGSIYTHMLFDTLLSRTRLRKQLGETSNLEFSIDAQTQDTQFEGKLSSSAPNMPMHHAASGLPVFSSGFVISGTTARSSGSADGDGASELECAPVDHPDARYEFPYDPNGSE